MSDDLWLRGISFLGLFFMVGLAWVLSEARWRVSWRLVGVGMGLQFVFALLILRTKLGLNFFEWAQSACAIVIEATKAGATFLFGTLPDNLDIGATVAFGVLPVIVFVSGLAGVLYHIRIIQGIVQSMAWCMRRTLGTSGAETFGAALLVFLGVESMAAIKGYLETMTRSELFTIMTTFMATIAASVMVAYVNFGADAGHLLAASIMSAPAAIVIAKIMVPETEFPKTQGKVSIRIPIESHNVVDAAARGGSEGMAIALNAAAMFIVFLGLVYLINLSFSAVFGHSFTEVMGWFFIPFAYTMGIPWSEVTAVSGLLGTKTVLNEFLAYADMQALVAEGRLSERSLTISTYALCGFANPGSVGILVAALTSLVPERRGVITQLGFRALVSGTLAGFTTACIAGVLA